MILPCLDEAKAAYPQSRSACVDFCVICRGCGKRLGASPQQAVPANPELTLNLDFAQSQWRWALGSTLQTVHGTIALESGKLPFDPAGGRASGEFIAYATSGEAERTCRTRRVDGQSLERPDTIPCYRIIQWALKSPNTFLLKADPAVEIELELSGTIEGAVAP